MDHKKSPDSHAGASEHLIIWFNTHERCYELRIIASLR